MGSASAAAGARFAQRFMNSLTIPLVDRGVTTTGIDKVLLDETSFGKGSARGSGWLGLLNRGAGGASDEADFWVSFDAAELLPALLRAGSTIFKELEQILAAPKQAGPRGPLYD